MSGSAKKKCCCQLGPATCSDFSTCVETLGIEIHNLIFTSPQGDECVIETDETGPIILNNTQCPPFFPHVYLGVSDHDCAFFVTWLILCIALDPPFWQANVSLQSPPGCVIQGTNVFVTAAYQNFSGPLCPPFQSYQLYLTDGDPGWQVDAPDTLAVLP